MLLFALLLVLVACQKTQTEQAAAKTENSDLAELGGATSFGEPVTTAAGARSVSQVPLLLHAKDSLYTTLSGTALTSCTKKGCWMTVDLGEGESMRVTFKDYGFFVPKDLNGEQVVLEGVLKRKINSVEELRHYAEDAGESKAAIAAIQQPDTAYSFEAVGVLIWPAQAKK